MAGKIATAMKQCLERIGQRRQVVIPQEIFIAKRNCSVGNQRNGKQ